MSIEKFIKTVCVQDAVYWGSPTADAYGGYAFADPVEVKVRWEEKNELIIDAEGKETMSMAQVLVTQDMDLGGYLYLGTLDELSSNPSNPLQEGGAWEIKQFSKTPMIKATNDFVRKVYL